MGRRVGALAGLVLAAAVLGATTARADPREVRTLDTACRKGERAACITLGKRLADIYDPLADRRRALALLRPVCDSPATVAEAAETCATVGELMLIERTLDESGTDPAVVTAYLSRACDSGSLEACRTLAGELGSGDLLPPDAPRARDLVGRLCRSGQQDACEALAPGQAPEPELASDTAAVPSGDIDYADLPPSRPEGAPDAEGQVESDGQLTEVDPSDEPRMVGVNRGIPLRPGSANWVAILEHPRQLGTRKLEAWQRVACGGSLIAPGWVLTAAHCLDHKDSGRVTPTSGHAVRLGAHNPFNEQEGISYPIREVIGHNSFTPATYAFDIALIRFDETRPIARGKVFGERPFRPVAVDARPPASRPISGRLNVDVLGWGRTSPDDPRPADGLRRGDVTLMSEASCTNATHFRDIRKGSVLCAAAGSGQHNCKGDSGGPLVLEDAQRRRVLIGVISMADACGDGANPSRFVRLTHRTVWAWLQEKLPKDAWRRMTLVTD